MTSDLAWKLQDLDKVQKNNLKVMSCFACGGGSTMGYKLSGMQVIAANDIDPEMQWHYVENHKPKYYFLCPIKDLLTQDLPQELYMLDILDGSPPCSSFSISGNLQRDWQKEKKFREGQQLQVLDDLFFDFIALADRLKPKCIIAENVTGLLSGNSKGYFKEICRQIEGIGYHLQVFVIDAADCGVPQNRERVFFVALRNDFQAPMLTLPDKTPHIPFGEAVKDLQELTAEEEKLTKATGCMLRYWNKTYPGESFKHAVKRQVGKESFFNHHRLNVSKPSRTITAHYHTMCHPSVCRRLTIRELLRLQSFPEDYKFKSQRSAGYLIGMSVPPRMTAYLAGAVRDQWLLNQNAA